MKGEGKKPALGKKQCSASLDLESFLFLFFIKAEHKRQAEHRCFSVKTFSSVRAKVITETKGFCWVINELKISQCQFFNSTRWLVRKQKLWLWGVYLITQRLCVQGSGGGLCYSSQLYMLCFTICSIIPPNQAWEMLTLRANGQLWMGPAAQNLLTLGYSAFQRNAILIWRTINQ